MLEHSRCLAFLNLSVTPQDVGVDTLRCPDLPVVKAKILKGSIRREKNFGEPFIWSRSERCRDSST